MDLKPLPEFSVIGFKDIPRASIILQAGSNWLTQWGNKKMGFPYTPSFTHAMVYLDNGDLLSMGWSAEIFTIQEFYKTSQRFVNISYIDMPTKTADNIIRIGYNRAGSDDYKFRLYDWKGYLGFLTRIYTPLKKISWLKGSASNEFCSDQVVNVFKEGGYPLYQDKSGNDFDPCDLFMLNSTYDKAFFHEIKNI